MHKTTGWSLSLPEPMVKAQRAAAEQRAKEVESQVAMLCKKAEPLAERVAQLQHQEMAIGALIGTLAKKDALLEVQGEALRNAETARVGRCRRSCSRWMSHGRSWRKRKGTPRVSTKIHLS